MSLEEEWKDIPGYEGLYQISNFGRVWSKEKLINVDFSNNWCTKINGFTYTMPGRFIKTRVNPYGYVTVSLTKDKKQKGYMVHRLVAQAFIPNDNPAYNQVNHKDENKQNNCITNLEWCTAKYNVNYGTCIQRRKEKQKYSNKKRIPVISIDENGNEKEYLSAWDASRQVGAYQSNIWRAIHTGNKCSGYYWRYKQKGDNYDA